MVKNHLTFRYSRTFFYWFTFVIWNVTPLIWAFGGRVRLQLPQVKFKMVWLSPSSSEKQYGENYNSLKAHNFFLFFICLHPEFLPVPGPLTRWCASTLGAALLCISRTGSWFGTYIIIVLELYRRKWQGGYIYGSGGVIMALNRRLFAI